MVDNLDHRICILEAKLDTNNKLVHLSENIVKLKAEEINSMNAMHLNQNEELRDKVNRLGKRLGNLEEKLGKLDQMT